MKSYLTLLTIIFYSCLCKAQQGWQAVGPDDFKQVSSPNAFKSKVYFDSLGGAYISYVQGPIGTFSNTFILKKETATGWVQLSQVIATGLYTSISLDKAGNFYLADDTLVSGTYFIRLRKFDGTSWSLAAPPYSTSSSTHPFITMKLDKHSNPTILFSDTGTAVFPKMIKWDGTNWNAIGGAIVNTSFKPFSFDFNSTNDPFVLHYDALTNTYQVKSYNGTAWNTVSTNVPGKTVIKIHLDTMYASSGTDGHWGGVGYHAAYSSVYKYNGTAWAYVGGINQFNTTYMPLAASSGIEFDNNGNIYLTGGAIWKISNGQTTRFGANGDMAIKGNDTFYTVDDAEYFNDKLRVIKKLGNAPWTEEYPLGIAPFPGGNVGTFSYVNSINYQSTPYHKFFADARGNLRLASPAEKALSTYNNTNGTWDTLFLNNGTLALIQPSTMLADTSNTLHLLQRTPLNDLGFYKLVGRNWSQTSNVNNNLFSSGGSFVFDRNNVPYTTYVDQTSFGAARVRVKKYVSSTWVDVSTTTPFVSASASANPLLVCDTANKISVLYKEGNYLYMKKFDGTNWNPIGGAIDTAVNLEYQVALTEGGLPVVVNLVPFSGGQLKPHVRNYNGTSWNTVGFAGFSVNPVMEPNLLVAGDTMYVAYTDKVLNKVIVAKFNGIAWGALGTKNISRDISSYPNLVKSGNDIYVSYFSDGLFVKKSNSNILLSMSPCVNPTLSVSNITDTSAAVAWSTTSSPILGYEYHLSTQNTPPTGNGSFTNLLGYQANGLQASTTYYFYLRSICGIDTSAWVMQPFTTNAAPVCDTPVLSINSVIDTAAAAAWTASTSALGYEYVLSTNNTTPAGSGIFTNLLTHSMLGLLPSTTYYFFIRTICSFDTSAWVMQSFTTNASPVCDTPTVTVNTFDDTSATLSWASIVQATGYEYDLSIINIPPSANGIFTNLLTYSTGGLQPGTTYYFFIRTICSFDTSAWVMQSFTTSNTTGVTGVAKYADLTVYPNPATTTLHIEQTGTAKRELELFDVYGRKIRSINFSNRSVQIDIKELPAGMYFLKSSDGERHYSFKIIKQ